MPAGASSRRGAVAAVAGVTVALGAVVVASRGSSGATAASFETASTARTIGLAVVAVALIACGALAAWALWPDGRPSPRPTPKQQWIPYLVVAALLVGMSVLASRREPARDGSKPPPTAASVTDRDAPADQPSRLPRASPTASLAVATVALAGLAVWTVRLRNRRRTSAAADDEASAAADDPTGEHERAVAELLQSVPVDDADAALALVTTEPDPRRAVQLAYALFERSLASTPAARPSAATPHEWLRQIRAVHRGSVAFVESSAALTLAYERARFGHRPTTEEERTQVVAALGHVLRATVASGAAARTP